MKKLTKILMIITAVVLIFTACAKQEEVPLTEELIPTPAPMPESTPEPTPEPVVFDEAAANARLQELVRENLTIDVSTVAGFPENMFAEKDEWNIFGTSQEERAWLSRLNYLLNESLDIAAKTAMEIFGAENQNGFLSEGWGYNCDPLSWQLMYTLIKGSNSLEQANETIKQSVVIGSVMEPDGGCYKPIITFDPLHYRDAIALLGLDEMTAMGCCFSYSYCITVYNEFAEEQEYVQPEPEGNFLTGITWPLESHTRLRKTWYADRDGGTRKHTGTDIWAAADTEMYSCTDGTVTFVGSGGGMGNAVIITDEYGYEFHYYHMIRLTDFLKEGDTVKAGDLIGHVGNTGNSARDHLHLTIVAPDGFYVNPYPYLLVIEP